MSENEEYIKDINELKDEAESNLEDLLKFAKDMVSSAHFRGYIKAKTFIRYNTFSAMYQRADAVLAMSRASQGNTANVIVRSMWETLVEYDFINLETSNINLSIRLATESKQQLATWSDVKRLRTTYPNADTWNSTISDEAISRTLNRRKKELAKFSQDYPSINLSSYNTLLSRLKVIDDKNLSRNPDHKTLTQFDYRSVYSLLSGDTHSTVLGNLGNSRIEPKVSLEIRLDAPIHESVRAVHVAYKFLLRFLQELNRRQKLKKGSELRALRVIDKAHDKSYKKLQDKYGF